MQKRILKPNFIEYLCQIMLEAYNLSCRRDGRILFSDKNFSLQQGQLMEIHGPNGSGKSTLLRCLAGLYTEFKGKIIAEEAFYFGHKLGFSALLTVEENIKWYSRAIGVQPDVDSLLSQVGMGGYSRVPCENLSSGQLRRVSLTRLLLGYRPLWLLDEPQTSLDLDGRNILNELMEKHISNDGSVVCATHLSLDIAADDTLVL